jgi:hypothetical protein
MKLKVRMTRLLWVGNATAGVFVAMLGALLSFQIFGYDLPLTMFGIPAGAVLGATGLSLTSSAVWRLRNPKFAVRRLA